MNYKNYCRGGQPYETPTVDVFAILSEGVLCQSYGDPNAPGKDLGEENVWDF